MHAPGGIEPTISEDRRLRPRGHLDCFVGKMGNTLTFYAVCIGILSLKIKWSDREENSSFSYVLRLTVIENIYPIHLFAFMSWCSNLITRITLRLCFKVVSKYFNSQLFENSFASI